jgi:hypothetical protein
MTINALFIFIWPLSDTPPSLFLIIIVRLIFPKSRRIPGHLREGALLLLNVVKSTYGRQAHVALMYFRPQSDITGPLPRLQPKHPGLGLSSSAREHLNGANVAPDM